MHEAKASVWMNSSNKEMYVKNYNYKFDLPR